MAPKLFRSVALLVFFCLARGTHGGGVQKRENTYDCVDEILMGHHPFTQNWKLTNIDRYHQDPQSEDMKSKCGGGAHWFGGRCAKGEASVERHIDLPKEFNGVATAKLTYRNCATAGTIKVYRYKKKYGAWFEKKPQSTAAGGFSIVEFKVKDKDSLKIVASPATGGVLPPSQQGQGCPGSGKVHVSNPIMELVRLTFCPALAQCGPSGSLACGVAATNCKDDDIWKTGRFAAVSTKDGKLNSHCGQVKTLGADQTVHRAEDNKLVVITKSVALHPDDANKNVGVYGIKRVTCQKAGKRPNTYLSTCTNFKFGECVKCQTDQFASRSQRKATDTEIANFMSCVKEAYNRKGNLKDAYKCPTEDRQKAEAVLLIM